MPLKLHRCRSMWMKIGAHPCWRVQKALDDSVIDYEVVKGPHARSRRTRVKELTGDVKYPVIEFEDGSAYREESKDMAATIETGRLFSKGGAESTTSESEPGQAR